MKNYLKTSVLFVIFFLVSQWFPNSLNACTRVVYHGPDGTYITARSMDWKGEIPANLWIFPRGMQRNGEVGHNSITWTSKYGSVVASSWDIAVSDGMNEQGLVANMLWLAIIRKRGGPRGDTVWWPICCGLPSQNIPHSIPWETKKGSQLLYGRSMCSIILPA